MRVSAHAARYLAEFEYRFNRRFRLEEMIPRLVFIAVRIAPRPYKTLKAAGRSG